MWLRTFCNDKRNCCKINIRLRIVILQVKTHVTFQMSMQGVTKLIKLLPLTRIPHLQFFITQYLLSTPQDLCILTLVEYVLISISEFCCLCGFPKSQKAALWVDPPPNVRCNNYGPHCSFYVQLSHSQYPHEFIVITRLNATWFQHVLNAYLEFLV